MKTTDLTARLTQFIEELADETTRARASEQMQAYLDCVSKFHQYSWHNCLLIALTRPDATRVAGFRRWLELKRFVRKGEKGIPILAPCVRKKSDDDSEKAPDAITFRVVYVFDISQTDGELLPPIPDWKSPARQEALQLKLLAFAAGRGIHVTVKDLSGETQGVSWGGALALSPMAGTKTLIHELAHELLKHHTAEVPRVVRELEAEAVAYTVARHYGIVGLQSPNYLALVHATAEEVRARLKTIQTCAAEIIRGVEGAHGDDEE